MKNPLAGIIAVFIGKRGGNRTARGLIASFIGMFVVACSGCGGSGNGAPAIQATADAPVAQNVGVGFFTPEGTHTELIASTQFDMVNAQSVSQVQSSLALANGTSFKVNIDLGLVVAQPMPSSSIGMTYHDLKGNQYTKVFAPLAPSKLRQFPSNDQIKALIDPYLAAIKQYSPNVGTIFLADEPYLNGISKAEMERAGAVARQELNAYGLQSVKLGVVFASGMFDRRFATLLDEEAGEYAKSIDEYRRSGQATPQWISTMQSSRLTTYDAAGNMYTSGGIPAGFDVIGFDFYLSTILLDSLHTNSLSWFAANFPDAGCGQFAGQTMTQIRSNLSFFDHDSMQPGTQDADRTLLDAIYQCRMQATTTMLQNDVAGQNVQLLMISESSNNGVLEFYADGTPKQEQPSALVEARVLDEVKRAERFFTAHEQPYAAGLMFFTYQNAYDTAISLNIGGASAMPSVMNSILSFAKNFTAP